jgi:hypothetical protein
MKDSVSLIVICLIVVLVAGWFLLPAPMHHLLSPSVGLRSVDAPAAPPQPEKTAAVAAKAPKSKPVRRKEDAVLASPVELQPTPAPSAPAPVIAAAPNVNRIPYPGEVQIGSDRSQIIDSFGAPALSASSADNGHLFETYLYRVDRRQAIIHLSDGRVSSILQR